MTYFPDLTPHTYTNAGSQTVLNVGWLGKGNSFSTGSTTAAFRAALDALCQEPIWLHRGFHTCEFCRRARGNGQIRIRGASELWYAAPAMIAHYVAVHEYLPPPEFVAAVLNPVQVADENDPIWRDGS